MLPTCAKRMWTFAAKIKSQYVDNLLPKCQNMWTFCCQNWQQICGQLVAKMSENLRIVAAKWKENAWILGTFFVDIRHLFVDIRCFFGWTKSTFLWTWGRLNSFILWEYGWRFESLEGMSIDSSRTPQCICISTPSAPCAPPWPWAASSPRRWPWSRRPPAPRRCWAPRRGLAPFPRCRPPGGTPSSHLALPNRCQNGLGMICLRYWSYIMLLHVV